MGATERHGMAVKWRGLKTLARAALIAITTWALFACQTPPPKWWELCPVNKELLVASDIEATDYLVVYLDVSKNMKGFVRARQGAELTSAQTVFSKSLLKLRNIVQALTPQPKVVLRVIDKKVHPPTDAFQLAQYASNHNRYRGEETNLAYAVKAFQEDVEQERKDARLRARPARFHILVTDGVQSTKERRVDVNCLHGSDSYCLKERINELLSKGWGSAVLGIRSDFNGRVFSEIHPRQSVEYASERDHPETFRPFYLYLFSPDQVALDNLVKAIKDGLRPLLKSADQLREFPLTLPYVEGTAQSNLISINDEVFRVSKEKAAPDQASCFNVSVALPNGGPTLNAQSSDDHAASDRQLSLTLQIPWSHHARDSGTPQEVAGLVKWELNPAASTLEKDARFPEMKVVGSAANPDGSVTLKLAARWEETAGKRPAPVYRLIGRLDLEKEAPPWIAQWSTDTDTAKEEATRTLNLKISLANLWNNQILQRQVVATTCLRVVDF